MQGFSPTEACELVVKDILERTSKENVEIGIIGVNMKVRVKYLLGFTFKIFDMLFYSNLE